MFFIDIIFLFIFLFAPGWKSRKADFLDQFAIAYTGAVARVVYSRFFPDWTKPQARRLNKSPQTVHAIANQSKYISCQIEIDRKAALDILAEIARNHFVARRAMLLRMAEIAARNGGAYRD
jgi:hypothetical protein